MRTKLDVFQTNQKQMDTGLTTFDLNVTSVINEIKEEGTKIKAMVDRHIEKMIATLLLDTINDSIFPVQMYAYYFNDMHIPETVCSNQLINIRISNFLVAVINRRYIR
jgi:transcription termination factor NusB